MSDTNPNHDLALSRQFEQFLHDLNLPTIAEDEWEARYGWLPTDEDGNCELLEDTVETRALLESHDARYIWSQIDDVDGGWRIVPGYRSRAIGWYLTERPWDEANLVAAKIPETADNATEDGA